METRIEKVRRILGEILSQLLNVPILSGLLATVFYLRLPVGEPNRLKGYLLALVFISAVPLLSLMAYIPYKAEPHEKTVHRQRMASFALMAVSFPMGWAVLTNLPAPAIYTAMLETYTFVTLGLMIFNLIFHYKASGHAAGVSGPVTTLLYLYGMLAAPVLLLLPLVTWARMAAKGHDFWQLVVGGVLSMTITLAVLNQYGFVPFTGKIW
jgi:hypothetical protein